MRKHFVRAGAAVLALAFIVAAAFAAVYLARKSRTAKYADLYSPVIERECEANSLDESLLRAVIYCESGYDASAVSSVGARGLMQLTEETFDWIAWRLGETDEYSYDDVFDPELNVRYGAYLLRYLLDLFDGQEQTALAAYHAGVSCVKGWLSDTAYSADGITLDRIPYEDTASYVSWVTKTKNKYMTN